MSSIREGVTVPTSLSRLRFVFWFLVFFLLNKAVKNCDFSICFTLSLMGTVQRENRYFQVILFLSFGVSHSLKEIIVGSMYVTHS